MGWDPDGDVTGNALCHLVWLPLHFGAGVTRSGVCQLLAWILLYARVSEIAPVIMEVKPRSLITVACFAGDT